jgi:hypothetical protein
MVDPDADLKLFGALEMMILRPLKRQPLHGYALAQHQKQTSNDLLQIEEGSLYPALQRLLKEPFQLGDFISVIGIEGTAYDIQSRATIVSTKDGRRVVIPNAVLFTSPVAVESSAAGAA